MKSLKQFKRGYRMCSRFGHVWDVARRLVPCRIWTDAGVVETWYCPRCTRLITGPFDL
jgi:hypothetical protein